MRLSYNSDDTATKKKYIHIYQCKPGYILAEDLCDNGGILIIPRGVVIDENIIKKLNAFKIRQLTVYEPQEAAKEPEPERGEVYLREFRKDYRKNVDEVKQVLYDLAAGKKLDYEKIDAISDSVYTKVNRITNIIECMNEVKNVDEYTYTHCINVSVYAMLIARWLDMSDSEIREVVTAGVLHDIGKSKIPAEILNKRGALLKEEFEQIKNHSMIGYELSGEIPQLSQEIREGILMHHEWVDGNGYPFGLRGEEINRYAKIIAVADVYDALTSERIYKNRIPPFDTFEEFIKMGYGHFDAKVMMTFLSNIAGFYTGSKVKLSNGETGEVVFVPPQNIASPVVYANGRYIDLSQEKDLKIVEMVPDNLRTA